MIQINSQSTGSDAKAALARWANAARRHVTLSLTAQVLAVACWIALAAGIGHAIAAIAQGRSAAVPLSVALGGGLARAALLWLGERATAAAGRRMTHAAREEILMALSTQGAGLLAGAHAGARTAQIIDRTERLAGHAADWLPGMRLALIGPLVILIAVATQSWLAAALLLVSVLVLPLFIWLTASETAATARAHQASLDALSGAFQSRAAQAGLIRAFRAIGRETAVLEAASQQLRHRTMAILRVAFLSTAVLEFFASVSIALVAVYVGFKLLGLFPFATGETLTLAEGMTALLLAPEFFAPIRRLSGLHHARADARAAADMLAPWLARGAARQIRRLPALNAAPDITFERVTLGYGQGRAAVSQLSFTARSGEITVIAGPSGSGKTSCLLALLGQMEHLQGEIRVDGRALAADESLATSAAWLRQTPWLGEASLADNIALARPGAPRPEIEAAADAAGVLAFATPQSGGLDRKLARFGAGLSGGQRQRLALARAILRGAPLWLMDEPTAHLDGEAEADFLSRLRDLAAGRTVLIASHSPAVRAAADTLVELAAATPALEPAE